MKIGNKRKREKIKRMMCDGPMALPSSSYFPGEGGRLNSNGRGKGDRKENKL